MRLIDADLLEEEVHSFFGERSVETWFEIRDFLGEAEEVKAIPIEFIKKYYTDITSPYTDTRIQFEEMIRKWEEEQASLFEKQITEECTSAERFADWEKENETN